jgi:hypothetical protein
MPPSFSFVSTKPGAALARRQRLSAAFARARVVPGAA